MLNKNTPSVSYGYGYGYVVSEDLPNYFIGRLRTLIEALGLRETQEKSLKDLVDNEIWSQFGQSWRSQWISQNLYNEVRRVLEELKIARDSVNSSDGSLPRPAGENYKFKITYEVE